MTRGMRFGIRVLGVVMALWFGGLVAASIALEVVDRGWRTVDVLLAASFGAFLVASMMIMFTFGPTSE